MNNGHKALVLVFSATLVTACAGTDTRPGSVAAAEELAATESTPQKYRDPVLYNTSVTEPDKVTCRKVPKRGSRIHENVCKTNRAWGMGHRGGRNMAEDIQRKALLSATMGNGG